MNIPDAHIDHTSGSDYKQMAFPTEIWIDNPNNADSSTHNPGKPSLLSAIPAKCYNRVNLERMPMCENCEINTLIIATASSEQVPMLTKELNKQRF